MEAWQEFVRRFQPVIAGVTAQVARLNGDASPSLIDDLTQEVYLKLCADGFRLLRECRLSHENSIFAYLKYVSASVAHDYFKAFHAQKRGAKVNAGTVEDAERNMSTGPETWSVAAEKNLVLSKIEGLVKDITAGKNAERDRLVFWLYYREGMTTKAIAELSVLNLGQKGVESLLSRITGNLRKELLKGTKRAIPAKA